MPGGKQLNVWCFHKLKQSKLYSKTTADSPFSVSIADTR